MLPSQFHHASHILRADCPLNLLQVCQKSLSAYLEAKRAEFPRFYFVSDPVLLEILSLGSDPAAVVPHFQSGLFDSLANVTFDKVRVATNDVCVWGVKGYHRWLRPTSSNTEQTFGELLQGDKTKITEMFSQQGEKVLLETPVDAKGG